MDHQSETQNANFIQNHRCQERGEENGAYVCCANAEKGETKKKKKKKKRMGRKN